MKRTETMAEYLGMDTSDTECFSNKYTLQKLIERKPKRRTKSNIDSA